MTVSPWLTFEKLKELQEQIDNAPSGGEDYVEIDSSLALPIVTGSESVAIGGLTNAAGTTSICLGVGATTAAGSAGISIGAGANSVGLSTGTIVIGSTANTSQTNAMAIGSNASSTAVNAIAFGINSTASAASAIQLGSGTNNTASTLQFLTNTIADTNGLSGASLASYDDDAAAGTGGLTTGQMYQTTGAGAAPLNVAGIVMVKQ